ncbi:UDP-forming cellulose synthase catalytic subunit [Oricola thermophila]|uniref:Cellulose synthase catalytic subunit [UDP-forming] n=2 Tax=Oricola thermophila TaxID=2742145 RepID=A0A6N1VHZ6_9HYPH|nr:UDP-forming cellulose synthase catalytic subunit [Oricola thermophila]
MFLIAQPVGTTGQLIISLSVIVMLTVISVLRLDGTWRHIFLAVASVIVLRYAFWRTTNTLPPADDLYSFIPALLLYGAEMYCILMLAISLFVVSDPIDREPAPQFPDEELPTIDVFVPSYNEGKEILALTLAAAKAMVYPKDKLRIYLLDDGGTLEKRNSPDPDVARTASIRHEELRTLCRQLGVRYHARAENRHAKAGNLNAGLEVSEGDLVVVFDADHAPEKNFLKETVGYFLEDPKLFLVQTPHFFANADPLERNLGTFGAMPSENEMFYHRIQKGLDRWNASFFCGSAAVLRRDALRQVGGFSGITITEDCETALELHSRGWTSIYVDKPLISGLQPDTLASFIGQRSRWCRGMIQIMLLRNPLLQPGLTFPQRLSYLSSNLFWMFPLVRLAFFAAPLLFILFDMKIYVASLDEFFAYTVTYLIVAEMVRTYLYGNVRWPWISELYEYIQTVFLVRAIISVFLSPRSPKFNVTEKGHAIEEDTLSELAWPYFAIFTLFCVSLAVAIYRYQTEPEISGLLLVVGAWNFLNVVIAGAALGVVIERKSEQDSHDLLAVGQCDLVVGEESVPVSVASISPTRARLIPARSAKLPDMRRGGKAILWRPEASPDGIISTLPVSYTGGREDDGSISVRFEPDTEHYAIIADLMMSDLSPARDARADRRKRRSIILSTWTLLAWALRYPPAAAWMAITGRRRGRNDPQPVGAVAPTPRGSAAKPEPGAA